MLPMLPMLPMDSLKKLQPILFHRFARYRKYINEQRALFLYKLDYFIFRSEIHAVMTGGFATIAGTVLGAYIG